ncbi:MAG: glycosyltransferase, partial [Planctomycetes bacterium]|nr:glycosyltransferase [Planctomycetota bacterium]
MQVQNDTQSEPIAASISVFFPFYNEQDNVAETAKKAIDVLEKINADYELIIVDDGSK